MKVLKYFTIHPETLVKHQEEIKPVGEERIFIFDIDDTLYKMTDAMHKVEIDCWYNAFKKLNPDEITREDFVKILLSSPMFGANIYKILGKTAKEVEDLRDFSRFYSEFVFRNDKLIKTLRNLPNRKWCFTNGLKCRAEAILQCLGIEDIFEGVVCIDDREVGETGKPNSYSYEFVEKLLKITNTKNVYFFDDSTKNINEALNFGWTAIKVEKDDDIVLLIEKTCREICLVPER